MKYSHVVFARSIYINGQPKLSYDHAEDDGPDHILVSHVRVPWGNVVCAQPAPEPVVVPAPVVVPVPVTKIPPRAMKGKW